MTAVYQSLTTHVVGGVYVDTTEDFDTIRIGLQTYKSNKAKRPTPIDRAYSNLVLISIRHEGRIWTRDAHLIAARKALLARFQGDERFEREHPELAGALSKQGRAAKTAEEMLLIRIATLRGEGVLEPTDA
ncbi:hypothetical protein [Brevundimonas viscosa]|uniref:Uncharacterized protein n=1 Tax=Brevundimonas viscosa TaxID=871741 RepID=A0A1I6TPF5_9CAUL|nr:hypothetical protein [Brevundimonas viscosa]SFS91008.1 hypothetical protein SAMN05192570_0223 [Brevundimonas viscosa]